MDPQFVAGTVRRICLDFFGKQQASVCSIRHSLKSFFSLLPETQRSRMNHCTPLPEDASKPGRDTRGAATPVSHSPWQRDTVHTFNLSPPTISCSVYRAGKIGRATIGIWQALKAVLGRSCSARMMAAEGDASGSNLLKIPGSFNFSVPDFSYPQLWAGRLRRIWRRSNKTADQVPTLRPVVSGFGHLVGGFGYTLTSLPVLIGGPAFGEVGRRALLLLLRIILAAAEYYGATRATAKRGGEGILMIEASQIVTAAFRTNPHLIFSIPSSFYRCLRPASSFRPA